MHMLYVCIHILKGMCAHTHVCVCMLRIFPTQLLYQNHHSSQSFRRLGPKSILGILVMLSLGNRCSGGKGYKMRCLHLHAYFPCLCALFACFVLSFLCSFACLLVLCFVCCMYGWSKCTTSQCKEKENDQ